MPNLATRCKTNTGAIPRDASLLSTHHRSPLEPKEGCPPPPCYPPAPRGGTDVHTTAVEVPRVQPSSTGAARKTQHHHAVGPTWGCQQQCFGSWPPVKPQFNPSLVEGNRDPRSPGVSREFGHCRSGCSSVRPPRGSPSGPGTCALGRGCDAEGKAAAQLRPRCSHNLLTLVKPEWSPFL